jgi:hypothetical protein
MKKKKLSKVRTTPVANNMGSITTVVEIAEAFSLRCNANWIIEAAISKLRKRMGRTL